MYSLLLPTLALQLAVTTASTQNEQSAPRVFQFADTLWSSPPSTRPSAAAQGTSCDQLAALALPGTTITLAQPVAAGAFTPPRPGPFPGPTSYNRMPAFCRVAATISPVPGSAIRMEVWLPAEGWNGKFVGVGNGGFSGEIWYVSMAEPLIRGYAVAGTDTGHEGGGADATFGIGQPERLIDFGWRAVHEMTVKSKAIAAAHYGRGVRHSLWLGCSSGGRQGLKAAQRFAADYDGISAGAPANNWIPLMAHATRLQRILTDPVIGLKGPHLARIKQAAIAACDARDGVTDRVVEDPRSCAFDPSRLQCGTDSTATCLTPRQVEAVRSVYSGVRAGGTLLMPGPTPGGEPLWGAFTPNAFPIGVNYFRDLVLKDQTWDVATFDLERDIPRAMAADVGDFMTTKADLREFFARGGKLLLWHGWTDGMIPAENSVDYYQQVLAASGPDARNGARLFMLPGVDHCAGGEGPDQLDALGVIDAWVEGGKAPERVVARKQLKDGAMRSRPLCAYPQVARYKGTGSTDDEASFECRAP
jgi:feruloyl esterase